MRRAPLRAAGRSRPTRGSLRRPPRGASDPRSVRAAAMRGAHGSSPSAAPAPLPTMHRAARAREPARAGRDRRPPPPAPARRAGAAARATPPACRPRKATPARAGGAAARRSLRGCRGSRSARPWASRRPGARGRARQSRSGARARRRRARRRARPDAAGGFLRGPPLDVFIYSITSRAASRPLAASGAGEFLASETVRPVAQVVLS